MQTKDIIINKAYQTIIQWLDYIRYVVYVGGRGSGKSFQVALCILLLACIEEKQVIAYVRYTMKSAHISIIPEFTKKIKLLGLEHLFEVTKNTIIHKKNGSEIRFFGLKEASKNQVGNTKSIEGVTTLVIEEAAEIDEEMFDRVEYSVRSLTHLNRIILILNPETKEHWIYKRFIETKQENAIVYESTYLDNLDNLHPSFIAIAENLKKTNYKKYCEVFLTNWKSKKEGVIFKYTAYENEPPKGAEIYGLDFGFSKDQTALIKCTIGQTFIYAEELIYELGQTTNDLIKLLAFHKVPKSCYLVCDSASPERIEEIKRAGYNAVTVNKKDIEGSIELIRGKDLFIDSESTNLRKELDGYTYTDLKTRTGINHAIDAMRYAHMYYSNNLSIATKTTHFAPKKIRRK